MHCKTRQACLILSILLLCVSCTSALARGVTVNGTVISTESLVITSPLGGRIETVLARTGDAVAAGDALVSLQTSKVYATEDGTVYYFGEVGDPAGTVSERYGAVAYLEGSCRYTLSASTRYAYTAQEGQSVHPGETVYLKTSQQTEAAGTGTITAISGDTYTVRIASGTFTQGETVQVFRNPDCATTSRIGKGTIELASPAAYTADGILVAFSHASGEQVKKGDVLFETLEGTYTGAAQNLNTVTAPAAGILTECTLRPGDSLSASGQVATLALDQGMRIEVLVSESDLAAFQLHSPVQVEVTYAWDGNLRFEGTVERISQLGGSNAAESESDEAWYSVYILPETTQQLAYGMHVVVSVPDAQIAE